MAKVSLKKIIARLPAEEQIAIHARAAKITAARDQARRQENRIAKEGAAKLLSKAA